MTTLTGTSSSRSNHLRRAAVLLGLLSLVAEPLQAGGIKSIAISSTAAPNYVRPLDAQGKPRPESYIFSEDHYMGGSTKDVSESKIKFSDITRMLLPSLAKQNYFPTSDVPNANILIMVHWGTTLTYEDPNKEAAIANMNSAAKDFAEKRDSGESTPNAGLLNMALEDAATGQQGAEATIARNAALLGYTRPLAKERRKMMPSPEELTMSLELNEERYFVVLMAYDYQYMRKEHQRKLLWVTRISVQSPGNNFTEAMPALVQAGANVFGRQLDGLVRVDAPGRGGRVDLGELKIMGVVEEGPKPDEKKK